MLDNHQITCEAQNTLGVEPGDGRGMNTSNRANVVSGMASIKHREDTVLLCKREGSHDDGG